MAGSFSMSCKAEFRLKLTKLSVTANISVPFHVTTKEYNYHVIFGRNIWELGIQLDFQNDLIGWQETNTPMKPIVCKMRTYFTIQDSKNVRNVTKRIKKILEANNERVNFKKLVNNLKYLSNDKQSLILKILR